jgi:murein DD-endopeptidase MepM/ murein hydrolase activator NlpD
VVRLPVAFLAVVLLVAVVAQPAEAVPAVAAPERQPGDPYVPFFYPPQLPAGTIENGQSPARQAASNAFMTLPFLGPHYVTAIFDHCSPNYVPDGKVCRYDGVEKAAGGFDEDAVPGQDWLYYDGHDGWDYGLYYEEVLAAADGVVTLADWMTPGCSTCGFGLGAEIDHRNSFTTLYGHLSQLRVKRGQSVRRGEVIGTSGASGGVTGAHLHFGTYRTAGMVPIDPYGWSGSGPDPWPRNAGNLWLGGAPREPQVPLPKVVVTVERDTADPASILVRWASAGGSPRFEVRVVEDDGAGAGWLEGAAEGQATFKGKPGHAYWFWVTAVTDLGFRDGAISDTVSLPAP